MAAIKDTATEIAEEKERVARKIEGIKALENNMQTGKAGEYLVCADLIIKGFVAYPSEQGLPYDVVLDINKRLYKVQVKTVSKPAVTPQRKTTSYEYVFNMTRCGKYNTKRYGDKDVDLFALVTLDTRKIGYILPCDFRQCKTFRVDAFRGTYYDEKGIRDYPKVLELHKQGMSNNKIAEIVGISNTHVGRMLKPNYEIYETKGQYFSEIERNSEWFAEVLGVKNDL